MKYTEDDNFEQECFFPKKSVDADQDILIDNLQAAIDTLGDSITELANRVESEDARIEGQISQNGIEITLSTTEAVNKVKEELIAFEASIATGVDTGTVLADYAVLDNATVAKENVTESNITKATVTEAEITNANIRTENVRKSIVDDLTAIHANLKNLTVKNFDIEKLNTTLADIQTLKATLFETETVTAKIITAKKGWKVPNTDPDNTELLHLHVPEYRGEVKIFDKYNSVSISVDNGRLVTYRGDIFNVTFGKDGVDFYFEDRIVYKEMFIGSEDVKESTTEIVDKAIIERNVFIPSGVIIPGSNGESVSSSGIMGLNFIYSPDDPIRMDISDNGFLNVEVEYEDYDNTDIDFSFVNASSVVNPTTVEFADNENLGLDFSFVNLTSSVAGVQYEDENNSDISFDFVK